MKSRFSSIVSRSFSSIFHYSNDTHALREYRAVHIAGKILVGCKLGLKVKYANLSEVEINGNLGGVQFEMPYGRLMTPELYVNQMVTQMAGRAGEEIFDMVHRGSHADIFVVECIQQEMKSEGFEFGHEDPVDYAKNQAAVIIRRHIDVYKQLVRALLSTNNLTEAKITKIMQGSEELQAKISTAPAPEPLADTQNARFLRQGVARALRIESMFVDDVARFKDPEDKDATGCTIMLAKGYQNHEHITTVLRELEEQHDVRADCEIEAGGALAISIVGSRNMKRFINFATQCANEPELESITPKIW